MKILLTTTLIACTAVMAHATGVSLDVQPNVPIQANDTLAMTATGLTATHTVIAFFSAAAGSTDLGVVQLGLDAPIAYLVLGSSDGAGEFTASQNFPTIPAELTGLTFYMQVVDVVDGTEPTLAASNVDSFEFGS